MATAEATRCPVGLDNARVNDGLPEVKGEPECEKDFTLASSPIIIVALACRKPARFHCYLSLESLEQKPCPGQE